MALALMAKAFKLNYSTPTNNNQRISSNPHNRQISQPGINLGQDRHMQMVGDLDEIEEVNANCIFMANLQQASTSGTQTDKAPVYDSDRSAEERFENCIIKKENEYAKLWNGWYKRCEECKFDKISYDKSYNDMQQKIERLQAQLGDLKGTSENTKFGKQSILGKPPKVGETHALSKPVTSNSISTPQGSKVVKNAKVIVPGMLRINSFNPYRDETHVPNKVRASVRTNPITVSQPPVITKKVVNSDSNSLSSTGLDNTKTSRPQPRSNTKNNRVHSTSKSSCSKNKRVDVEEYPRNFFLFKNKKHMSYECNNVKLATQNVNSKVVYAMCKQCLISVNHDVIRISLWCVDSGCSKRMTGNLKLLINFVWKFLGTIRFGNDHIAAIIGFGDLQWGNILITRLYFVEGLGYNCCSQDLDLLP
nr:integrase, catalytic region, zinc finger, CCHC-type, peptidase aspartic, catalytic [Tanacetum cinerariifolium]